MQIDGASAIARTPNSERATSNSIISMNGASRHNLVQILSLAGVILDALGALYLAYDLLGGKNGPLQPSPKA
jgi:hypothetical protein